MRIVALLLFTLFAALPARATPPVVDVELVLAVDVSWSMDIDEQVLQRAGYVEALRDPALVRQIQKGDWGSIAVTYVEWAGAGAQRTLLPWTIISDQESANAASDRLAAVPIGTMRRTSISGAIDHSLQLFDNSIDGMRRVIDVSGDGPNNQGRLVTLARDEAIRSGVTINGLPIMTKNRNPSGYFHLKELDIYYEDCVIGGFGAFMISVLDPANLKEAIRRKLILEIAGVPPQVVPATYGERAPRIDCEIGEKQWQRWRSMNEW